ncbi:MAG: thiamine diphosphokinase [Bacteroidetes bacterium]|nr:thiamine diphosphokinase [Bacteroidota bacterium]
MQAVVFLNGRLPDIKIIKKFLHKNTLIIAADGGANYLKEIKLSAHFVIGDFDSINEASLAHFKKKQTVVIQENDQETTDFEKALKLCIKNKVKGITVFGATGMRPDHTLNNFSILKRFYKKTNIVLITDEFAVFYLPKRFSFNYKSGETVSLVPMPIAAGVKTKGLMYPLNNETLEFGKREGALNKSDSDKVSISFKEGDLLIFRKHFLK